ncbi:hypothetical protein H0H93_010915 [Arthromyces matolae]|nr:hypothetical protein H0H93_010915 [Arthromyces matolae]
MHKLGNFKSTWLPALQAAAKTRALSCPLGVDLHQLSANDLRRVARRTHRLERNWELERPRIARAIRSVPYSPSRYARYARPTTIIAVIPATSLVFLHTELSTEVVVCDTEGVVPLQSFHVGSFIRHEHHDVPGRHLMVVHTRDRYQAGFAVYYERVADKGWTIRSEELFRTKLPPGHPNGPTFMSSNTAGLLRESQAETTYLRLTNFHNNVSIDVDVAIPSHIIFMTRICFVDRTVYLVSPSVLAKSSYSLHCCPLEQLVDVSSNLDERALTQLAEAITAQTGLIAIIPMTPHKQGPESGWEAVEVKISPYGCHGFDVAYSWNVASTTYAWFSPIHSHIQQAVGGDLEDVDFKELEPSKVATIAIEGRIHRHQGDGACLLASSESGRYSAVIIEHMEERGRPLQLYLIQRDIEPLGVHARKLDLPDYIDLSHMYAVGIEERYGVIHLVYNGGYMFSLPYV